MEPLVSPLDVSFLCHVLFFLPSLSIPPQLSLSLDSLLNSVINCNSLNQFFWVLRIEMMSSENNDTFISFPVTLPFLSFLSVLDLPFVLHSQSSECYLRAVNMNTPCLVFISGAIPLLYDFVYRQYYLYFLYHIYFLYALLYHIW